MAVEILERFRQTSVSSSERIDRYPPVGVGHQEVVTQDLAWGEAVLKSVLIE